VNADVLRIARNHRTSKQFVGEALLRHGIDNFEVAIANFTRSGAERERKERERLERERLDSG